MDETALIRVSNDIAHYAGYPLIIIGTLANIVCTMVLIRPKMRATSIGHYLLALSINDIFVLNVSQMDKWLRNSYNIDGRLVNLTLCKILPFLDKFLLQMASWIVVAVSLERLMAICQPIRYKTSRKYHRPILLVSLIVIITCINAPILYYYELDEACKTSASKSYIKPKYIIFYFMYWALPLLFLVVSNSIIIFKFNSLRNNLTCNRSTNHFSTKESASILFFINVLFITCTSPFAISGILWTVLSPAKVGMAVMERVYAAYVISHVFSYLNNAINFVPYMLMSSTFRQELAALFRINRSSPEPSTQ